MRKLKVVFILTVCLATSAHAASTASVLGERALREECSDSFFSQGDVQNCLLRKANASEKALKQAEEKVIASLSKWDEDDKYIIQAKEKLAASSREFIKYRKAHCAFASSLGGGAIGSALEMGRLACVAELNNRRAEQLRDAVSDLPLK